MTREDKPTSTTPSVMFCHQCGKLITSGSRFCNHCGAQAPAKSEPSVQMPFAPASQPLQREELIFNIRPAFYNIGVGYSFAAIFSLLATALVAYLGGPLWLALILAAFCFILPTYRHIKRNRTLYRLTSTKIEIEYGLFSQTVRNIPLRSIQDVTVSATLSERMIGIGDVIIDSAAVAGKIPMLNIREPRKYADLILGQLRRQF